MISSKSSSSSPSFRIGLEVRNVPYAIATTHEVKIQPPFRYYKFPDDPKKPDAYVESIKFDSKSIWKSACKKIRAAVLEFHREELPKLE